MAIDQKAGLQFPLNALFGNTKVCIVEPYILDVHPPIDTNRLALSMMLQAADKNIDDAFIVGFLPLIGKFEDSYTQTKPNSIELPEFLKNDVWLKDSLVPNLEFIHDRIDAWKPEVIICVGKAATWAVTLLSVKNISTCYGTEYSKAYKKSTATVYAIPDMFYFMNSSLKSEESKRKCVEWLKTVNFKG